MSLLSSQVRRAKSADLPRRLGPALLAGLLLVLPCTARPDTDTRTDTRAEGSSATEGAVRIRDGGIHPETLRVHPGQSISWINEEEQAAVLSFPEGMAEPLACGTGDLRPEFFRNGSGRIVSTPIDARPFALPCPLPPGTYAYEVHLHRRQGPPGAPVAPPSPVEHPNASFDGTLVVE